MISLLKKHDRFNEALFLGITSVLCFTFSIFRYAYSDTSMFLFLNWNLFLAFVPWALSSLVMLKPNIQRKKRTIVALLFTWLVFFPNAPYILTDLFHLNHNSSMPIWFDLVLILSFAWIGLVYGILSLWDLEQLLLKHIRPIWTSILSSGFLFLASFGIYLGRYLRWNSWDIVNHPSGVIYDISDRVLHPFDHPRTWGVTLFMGIFLNMVYWAFKLIRKRKVLVET